MIKFLERLYYSISNYYWKLVYKLFRSKYIVDESFKFNGKEILFYGDGEIRAGSNSYIGSYSSIQSSTDCKVTIGKGCMISHNVRIYTSTLDADQDMSNTILTEKFGDVFIGDFVWIGANVFINPGIRIGDNAVIGANSVVTRNVAEYTIVGGVPAKEIRKKKCFTK